MTQTKIFVLNKSLAIFAGLLFVSLVAPLFHFQPITGPIVNAMLFLGAVLLPIEYALMLCMLPSLAALSFGALPVVLAPMIPFIMFSNAILVVVFKEGTRRKELSSFLTGVLACLSKFGNGIDILPNYL
mgnify:FL=1